VGTAPVDVDLHAVSTNVRSIRPFETTGGRWFSEGPYVAPELVVNRAAAEVVPSWEVPGELVLGDREHRVRVRLRGAVEDGIESPTAYVRESDAPQLLAAGLQPSLQSVSVTVPGESEQQLRSRISNLTALLGAASQLSDVGRTDSLSQFEDQLSTSRGLLMTIAALSLLIGALGILNIGLATLRDRSEEWAVRRALGASRRQVLVMVLVESQLVALSAAVLALGIAAATVPWTLQQLSAVPLGQAPLPWRAAALGMVASSLAAFAGAVAPAVRTSRTALSTLLR
jgi:putative ABC transport system permease protein